MNAAFPGCAKGIEVLKTMCDAVVLVVAAVKPKGMQITDRSKDVIKSGGEWIGSIDLENIAMAHPAVAMAACIAARHAKWDERPLPVVTLKPGREVTRDHLLAFVSYNPCGSAA